MQEDVYQGNGLNLYAYCGNNPVIYYDPSGYKKGSNSGCPPASNKGGDGGAPEGNGSGKSSVLDNAINNGQPLNNHRIVLDTEASSLLATKQPPNSSADLLNPDGSVKQRRYYGEDGKAQMDIDFNHTDDGTHEFPHIHIWDWTKKPPRQDSRR